MTNTNTVDSCVYLSRIEAYHDKQLAADERGIIADHLAQCPLCSGALAQLHDLSLKLQRLAVPADLSAVVDRLHHRVDYFAWRRMEQLAGILTGLAACLAVAAAIQLMRPAASPPAPAPWERAALQLTDDSAIANGRDTELAHWMVADLSSQDSAQGGVRP